MEPSLPPTLPIAPPPVPPTAVPTTPPKPKSKFPLLIGLLVVIILSLSGYIAYMKFTDSAVSNYDECVTIAGSRIQESYPPTCVTPKGDSFTQIIEAPQNKYDLGEPINPTASWKEYTSTNYLFSFKYPSTYTLEEYEANGSNMIINKNQPNSLAITVRQSKEDYAESFLDHGTTGDKSINKNIWLEFMLPEGYSDGGIEDTTPIYALKIVKNNYTYTVVAGNTTQLSPEQTQILQTFQFIENPSKL